MKRDRHISCLREHYRNLFLKYGNGHDAVQYSDKETHELRFRILSEIGDLCGKKVLDFGCGTGHLASYLSEHEIFVDYTGVDIVEEFLECAQKMHPHHRFCDFEEIRDEKFDYVFICGVFNNVIDDNVGYYKKIIKECFDIVTHGIAFNMLSSYVDYYDEGLFYQKPEDVFQYVKREVSPYVVLRNDYKIKEMLPPYEFTVYIYKG